jgi:phosphoribosylanthranilate isomerase
MRRVKVKICGITRAEDLEVACKAGADMVGFVVDVPSSPRSLGVEKAENLFRLVPQNAKSVLVTVPKTPSQLVKVCKRLKPDIIQLHGGNVKDYIAVKRVIPEVLIVGAVHVGNDSEPLESALEIAEFFDGVLVDSYKMGAYGGTGINHDWSVSRKLRDAVYPKPLILAGGLNHQNVREAIKTVAPYAVDVSSGVEASPGVKDHRLMEAFIKAVHEAVLDNDDYEGLGW